MLSQCESPRRVPLHRSGEKRCSAAVDMERKQRSRMDSVLAPGCAVQRLPLALLLTLLSAPAFADAAPDASILGRWREVTA
jgi:hypothetical protein